MKPFWKQGNKRRLLRALRLFTVSVGTTAVCMLLSLSFLKLDSPPTVLEASVFNGGKEFSAQKEESAPAAASTASPGEVIPLGTVFGIKLFTDGVIVASLSDIYTETGVCCPAAEAGIEPGDYLLQANGQDAYRLGVIAEGEGVELV